MNGQGPRQRPFPVDELSRAVRLEMAAELRADGDGEKVSLSAGRRIGGDGETREYLFTCRSWKEAFSGEKLLIRLSRSRDPWEHAEAARMPDGKVKVRTKANLGIDPANAQLRKDETVGLESILDRLDGANDKESSTVNLTTAGWLLGQGKPRNGRCATPNHFIRNYRDRLLNAKQRQAIEQALGSELTFIWGPPGTGKTDVVAAIAEGCYRQQLRVLFLAPTKVAVDQALERICDLLSGEEAFGEGLVQRAGEIELPSLAAKFGDQIDPSKIAERLSASLAGRIATLRERLEANRRILAIYAEAERVGQELRIASAQRDDASQLIAVLHKQLEFSRAAITDIEQQIRNIGTPSGLFAKRSQAKLDELGRAHSEHQNALVELDKKLSDARSSQQHYARESGALEREFAVLSDQLRAIPAVGPVRRAAEQLQTDLTALEQDLHKITEVVRRNCRVMGTTVAKAVQSRNLLDSPDVVIIDEAGMVNLPSAWCAAGLASRRVVIAGDFRQLPAVTRASGHRDATPKDREHAKLWMDRDAFATAGLVDAAGSARRNDPRMVCLDTQYRMRPAICDVVNVVAYPDAPLRPGRDDLSRLPSSPLLSGPLILVDTTPRRLPNPEGRYGAHTTNSVHEAVIHELIRGLQHDDVLPARKWTDQRPTDRMAVIAPYKDQVRALRGSLEYRFGQNYEGLVDTVHRFQGSQRPLVVIDTVAGAGSKLGYFYEDLGLASHTCRLLNVALSRAQDHLIVVADTQFLRSNLRPGSEAGRMLDHLERHAHRLPVDDLVPFRAAGDLANLPEDELARPAFFPADEVPRAVEWDIDRARGSIDIFCAFLDPRPVRRWLGRLTPRIQAGVQVTVHTRDQSEDPRRQSLVRDLEMAGCRLVVRERMHEKVLIIDDNVLWHGSLNLLANIGPTELMMRITDPTACRRVRHIVERARMERPARPWRQGPTAGADVESGGVLGGRRYIRVPYRDKEAFKQAMRAAAVRYDWDDDRKMWHIDASVSRHLIQRWLPVDGA
ncbi:AAA domain-containing protein [Nonomuraea sp. NPDC050783]|uniref:AAA domain-containing protein n=1 Tax=Nonomuraea sp. NPDC050783 TaxID=3154634 RepID=UPI0034662C51